MLESRGNLNIFKSESERRYAWVYKIKNIVISIPFWNPLLLQCEAICFINIHILISSLNIYIKINLFALAKYLPQIDAAGETAGKTGVKRVEQKRTKIVIRNVGSHPAPVSSACRLGLHI